MNLPPDSLAAPPATPRATVDTGPLRRAGAWRWPELAFWLVPIAAWALFPKQLALLSQIAITALFALSLDLILGFAGIVSLGQAAFFGLGAYTAGLAGKHGLGDPLLGLALGAAVAGAAGYATSFLVLRGTDLTRLLVTLGVAMILYEGANKLHALTGGVDGLQGIEIAPLLGRFAFDLYGRTAFWYSVAVLFAAFWVARRVVHSPFGLSLRGIRLNAARMAALGVDVSRRLRAVYTIAAALAGVAGALLTQTTQFVSLDVFSLQRSAEVLLIVVLGGAGCLYGALIGTLLFMVAHHWLADINPQYWPFWLGATLLLVVLVARDGAMGLLRRLAARLPGRMP